MSNANNNIPAAGADVFARLRAGAAAAARRARFVSINNAALEELAAKIAHEMPPPPRTQTNAQLARFGPRTKLAYIITMNALNFGSGWFPHLRKREGLSGYNTLAAALHEQFAREGPWNATQLSTISHAELCELFAQKPRGAAGKLMALYKQALNDLGEFLQRRHQGGFAALAAAAQNSAANLVAELARMPFYRDVAHYQGIQLPFYKRAQITAADLSLHFGGQSWGAFGDINQLTMFADNLVPHTLRMLGVLEYAPPLLARIEREELLPPGAEEEVEIRAVALHAVEELVESCARRGFRSSARALDLLLWSRGQHPAIKAQPRHRTRCTFY